jgi:hypothetical protein
MVAAIRSRPWRAVLLFVVAAGTLAACAGVLWRLSGPSAARVLPERIEGSARGEAPSHDRIRLAIRLEGRSVSTVTIRPGDMATVEAPGLRIGLQARTEGTRLRTVLHRLEALSQGESARYLLTRDLEKGQAERVAVDGVGVVLTWLSSVAQPNGVEATETLRPCCVTCEGVTVCGELVGSVCGQCAGKPSARVSR